MSFDYTQEEITRLAKENNFTVAGIEKVMRLSNILNDLTISRSLAVNCY